MGDQDDNDYDEDYYNSDEYDGSSDEEKDDDGGEMNSTLEKVASGEEISSEGSSNDDFQGPENSANVNHLKASDKFSGVVNVGHRKLDIPHTFHETGFLNAVFL